jgi:transposase
MRVARPIALDPEQRLLLEQQSRARSLPARQVERARIALRAADGWQDKEIAAEFGITPEKAARWRNRFLDGGFAALQKDAPRPGRPRTVPAAKVKQIVDKTTQEKPDPATHWSTRTMAAAVGVSEATVRRIWHAHGLKPHLVKTFKVSNDPQCTTAYSLLVRCSLYAVGERSLFHTLRNAPSVMGRAPARRKTTSPTMRSHSSLW